MMNPAFNVKSARLDALAIQLHGNHIDCIRETLEKNIDKYIKFKNLPFILDISQIEEFEQIPLGDMIMLFAYYKLNIIALRHLNPLAATLAAKHNLCFVSASKQENLDDELNNNNTENLTTYDQPNNDAINKNDTLHNDNDLIKNVEMVKIAELVEIDHNHDENNTTNNEHNHDNDNKNILPEQIENDTENNRNEKVALHPAKPTIVVSQPVRTGQQIYAEQADLIILGSVSPGAEVIADGNIHIYATLRGRALAGASGDENARIFVQSMQAELVSIAGIYRVFEQKLPPHLHQKAVQIELQEDRLAIGPIQTE